ncbi:hypothetical protein ACTU44_11985 [Thalassospira sp. SM2505]
MDAVIQRLRDYVAKRGKPALHVSDISAVLDEIQSRDREIVEHIESELALRHLCSEADAKLVEAQAEIALYRAALGAVDESAREVCVGGGDVVVTSCEALEQVRLALKSSEPREGGYPMRLAPRDGKGLLIETSDFGWVEGYWDASVPNFYASNKSFLSYDPDNAQGDWCSDWVVGAPDDINDKRLYCGASPISWLPLPAKTKDPMFDDVEGGA